MQILNTTNSILFKDNDFHPIPQFYFINIESGSMDKAKDIILTSMNIKEVNKKLLNNNIKYNIVRIDEITHMYSYDMVH